MRFEDDEPKKPPQKKQAPPPPPPTPYRRSIWEKIGDFISDARYWIDDLPWILRMPLKLIIYMFMIAMGGVLLETIFEILL